jgi:S1-C subfamily serine protease
MSEHDEEQPPTGSWRHVPRAAWVPPVVDDQGQPWASPGYGQPYPGEQWQPEPPSTPPPQPPLQPTHPGYPVQQWQAEPTPPVDSGFAYPYQGYSAPPQYPPQYAPQYPPPPYPGTGRQDGGDWQSGGWQSGGWADPGQGAGGWADPAYGPAPGGAGAGWQPPPPTGPSYTAWGPAPAPGWAPYQSTPPPSKTNPFAVILIAILIAGLIGLGIGGQLVSRHTTTSRLPTVFPAQPSGGAGSGGGGLPLSQASAVAAAVFPSIVDINTKLGYQRAAAAGTGMVLTSDGQVLTNNHVIAGSTSLTATVINGKTYTAKVLGTDPTEDVALIKLDGASGLTPIRTGDPSKLAPGDPIVAAGNAGGLGGTPSVVTGTVVALDQAVTASDIGGGNAEQLTGMIEINAPLQPGDSGGPLINPSSQVVGMDTAASATNRVESQSSVGFAIPIARAISIAKEIAAGHASAAIQIGVPGFLGVSIDSTINTGAGATLAGVIAGSPSEKAGLAGGDIITSINGQPVDSPKTLTAILRQRHPGDRVSVGWTNSSGKKQTAAITLTVGPAA